MILRPLITEKGTHLSERHNAYTFEVNPLATKTEIKEAVEELFNVQVADVRTQNRRGKKRRYRLKVGRMRELEEGDRRAARRLPDRLLLISSPPSATPSTGRGGNAKDATPMGIRTYKPTSAGRRGGSVSDFAELTDKNKKPEKSLTEPLKKKGGRNNQGVITARFRGGGHKRMYRIIDFKRNDKDGVPAQVTHIEYDPNRSARIALIVSTRTARSATSSPRTG